VRAIRHQLMHTHHRTRTHARTTAHARTHASHKKAVEDVLSSFLRRATSMGSAR
jgi:hypothetical protein